MCAAAVLQVSVLNGTDLKIMINYTGEQVTYRWDRMNAQAHRSRTELGFKTHQVSKPSSEPRLCGAESKV